MTEMLKKNDIAEWIHENVRSYPEPAAITLSNFEVDWKDLTGSFRLSLDNELLDKRFGFAPDSEGSPVFSTPLIHSPLTYPSTMSTVNLTEGTRDAINNALQRSVPRVKSLGLFAYLLPRLKLRKGYNISAPVPIPINHAQPARTD
jgi:hypothetical protein